MVVTTISPEDFLIEIKRMGIQSTSFNKIRMMQKGKYIFCRVAIPQVSEILQTVIPIERFNKMDYMNLSPISVGAVWKDEEDYLVQINNELMKLNANNISPDRNQSLQSRPNIE